MECGGRERSIAYLYANFTGTVPAKTAQVPVSDHAWSLMSVKQKIGKLELPCDIGVLQ